jgi:hypothetical protein
MSSLDCILPAPAARSVAGFAQHHCLSRSRVYELIAQGRVIARKCGGRTLIYDSDNQQFHLALPIVQPRQPRSAA